MDNKMGKLGRGIEDILFGRKDTLAPVPIQPPAPTPAPSEVLPVSAPAAAVAEVPSEGIQYIPVGRTSPNPNQPRKVFTEEAIQDLGSSIQVHGLIQPVIVRKSTEGFELIAGERRFRAMKMLGKETIPAIVLDVDDRKSLELSLIENIQREDLNPIDRAKAYEILINQFKITHEEAAKRIGQSRASLTNIIRLLTLPEDIQDKVSRGTISYGHARALVTISDPIKQKGLAERIENEGLSVRQIEKLANKPSRTRVLSKIARKSANVKHLEESIMKYLGAKVTIEEGKNKGKLIIEFYTPDDFDRIIEKIGIHIE